MQLVVMATLLVLAGASKHCSLGCSLKNYKLEVKSCDKTAFINTTSCEGQCYQEDPVYHSPKEQPTQNVCFANWTYEEKHIGSCPFGVTYPVAKSCMCASCKQSYTDCDRLNRSCS
nr:gonadotropin subunit beta-1-like [Nerophis lumbriciformis]